MTDKDRKSSLLDSDADYRSIDRRIAALGESRQDETAAEESGTGRTGNGRPGVGRTAGLCIGFSGRIIEESCGEIPEDCLNNVQNDPENPEFDYDDIYFMAGGLPGGNGRIIVWIGNEEDSDEDRQPLLEINLADGDEFESANTERLERFETEINAWEKAHPDVAAGIARGEMPAVRSILTGNCPADNLPYYARADYFKGWMAGSGEISEGFSADRLAFRIAEFPIGQADGILGAWYIESDGKVHYIDLLTGDAIGKGGSDPVYYI